MPKNPKAFRLSDEAIKALAKIVKIDNRNETAAVEIALINYAKQLKK